MDSAASTEQQFLTNHDIIKAAHRNLGTDAWNYICSAAESETTMRRNRMSLDCLAFRPKVLVDVGEVDISTTFLGHALKVPVMMAPMGGVQNDAEGGALAPDDACEACGSINFVSTVTEPELEVTAANSPHPKVFQLYIRGDDDWIRGTKDECPRFLNVPFFRTITNFTRRIDSRPPPIVAAREIP